ncbi:hypothetical protein [Microvirus D_HF4_371]|nr:hypothetical protein [Microvirus D_HF4_371]
MVDIVDGETGEIVSQDFVEESYTREGRRTIGKEYPNPIPLAPPIGYVPQKPIYEQIREMVKRELAQVADDEGQESFEEADDFDVGDDFDPSSPYEETFEPTDPWPPSKAVADVESEIQRDRHQESGAEITAPERPPKTPIADPFLGGAGGSEPPAEVKRSPSPSTK